MTGTPIFFLGVAQPNGTLKVVKTLQGSLPFETFQQAIDAALGSTGER